MTCVRALYSRVTFQGWRVVDLEVYVRDAWQDYGIKNTRLSGWTFHETEQLLEHGAEWSAKEESHGANWYIQLPPPHHRVSPWGGNQ
jgi:hypothetical protein